MNTILIYMIKAAFYLAAFYLVYSFMLSHDTFHTRNRVYIILSVVLAMVLPSVTIYTSRPLDIAFFGKTLSEVLITAKSSGTAAISKSELNPLKLAMIIYLSGVFLYLSRLLFDFIELLILIATRKEKGSNIIRFSGLNSSGFSAMGYIFISSTLTEAEAEEIVRHEQNHIDHAHFTDIILMEVTKAVQWFNPFIYLFNRSLRAVHEYEADQLCLGKGVSIPGYQALIMNQVFRSKAFSITNSFSNPTLIKKRMIMMTKKRSEMKANLKILLVVPVIAAVMIGFSSCRGKGEPAKDKTEQTAGKTGVVEVDYSAKKIKVGEKPAEGEMVPPPPPPPPPVPYNVENGDTTWIVVDQMPVFKGGDEALMGFIQKNTKYPKASKENGIQGRVILRFAVKTDGTVDNVKVMNSVAPDLDAEAVRVISSLPKFEKPGMQKGKPVPVFYTVPITFALK